MGNAGFTLNVEHNTCVCTGRWSILTLGNLAEQCMAVQLPSPAAVTVDGSELQQLDSAGALVLLDWFEALKQRHASVAFAHFSEQHLALLKLVGDNRVNVFPEQPTPHSMLYLIGKEASNKLQQFKGLVTLVGDLSDKLFSACRAWRQFQVPSIVSNMSSAGIHALPIVGLLSFLIGVVLAYQMGLQLENYGATSFIAYVSGMAVFREFGPLITAIIVAGRTSSAFTAQIGSMKLYEEIDALYTMGLSPTELLVVPKLIGLLLVFPLLIFWSDFFGILGAMIMSKYMLRVSPIDFLIHLQDTVGFKQMMLGLYKAPTFAVLIALVGCFQGFRVEANADSVGHQTTRSVVQALFLIIMTDATYSVIYSRLNL